MDTLLRLRIALVVGALLWAAALPGAQAQELLNRSAADFRFERLDGLSHNTVLSMVQDREGFLWVGTPDGLNRYDGYDFKVYRHDPHDTTSLSNNSVKSLYVDRQGQLWVGTDSGLNRFDRRAEQFVRYGFWRKEGADVQYDAVLNILEDQQGYFWLDTSQGVLRYDPATGHFSTYPHDITPTARGAWGIFQNHQGELWLGTSSGRIHRYNTREDVSQEIETPKALTRLLFKDEQGQVWVLDDKLHIAILREEDGELVSVPGFLIKKPVRVVREAEKGLLWIGGGDGLYLYDPATHHYLHLLPDRSPGAYLQNHVWSLYEDQAGILWVGTLSGLYRLDPNAKRFANLAHDPGAPQSLTDNTIMAVREDRAGALWVGTLGGGLNRVDRASGTITAYRYEEGNAAGLCSDLIWSLHESDDRRLWIGTDAGLCSFDAALNRFTRHPLPLDTVNMAQPAINALHEDRRGRLWVATNTGLFQFDARTGDVAAWHRTPGDNPIGLSRYFFPQSLYEDHDGFLWLSTFGGILYRLEPDTGQFTRYPLFIAEGQELVTEGIWAIHERDDGTFWLGSDLGLTHFSPQRGVIRHYTQQEGLPGSIVYGILEDERGRLWLSTNRSLALYDDQRPEGQQLRVYDTGDGLVNTEFNRRAFYKGRDGTLYFGGLAGLTYFLPDQIQDNPYLPPLVLTQIQTSNRDSTLTLNPAAFDRLALSYREYSVTFAFAALNYTNPSQNQYAYQLEGFDAGWVDAGVRRSAHYTNLPPGDYVFRVRGSNDDGLWNEEGSALPLTIRPPFWQTWWFRMLLAALVVGLLTAAYRYRVERLIEVERMRLRIAGDLHDDIGSNLSSIALLSDMVQRREALGPRERRHLSKISASARTMVDALRDIVWSIDPALDGLDDLVQRMRDVTPALLGDTDWTFVGPSNGLAPELDMDVRRHLFLFYKEVLHNIAAHAQASAVTISLEEEDGHLRLTVSDDGVGFEETTIRPGNGLKHLHERATHLGGALTIESQPGTGTTIHLDAPLRKSRSFLSV